MMKLSDFGYGVEFWYLISMLFIIGACFGSFMNVVVLRAFSGESIVLPPSKCPSCGNKLKWYHNIPILSYVFLRGKCGFCSEKISIQYPLVEAFFACLFVGVFYKFGISLNALFLSAVAFMCTVLAVTDIKEQVIFDNHAYVLCGIGLIYNFFDIGKTGYGVWEVASFSINKSFVWALLGVLAGALVMEVLANVGKLMVGQRAFGEGDSFILGALGAVFCVQNIPNILIAGCLIQVIIILPLFLNKLIKKKEYKLLWSFGSFLLSVGIFKLLDFFNLLGYMFIFGFAFLLMGISALIVCKQLIKSTKSGENLTFVPFGPPLVIAALVLMFIH